MPVMDGTECVGHLAEIDAGVSVLVASGFAQEVAVDSLLKRGAALLPDGKPVPCFDSKLKQH